MRRERSGRGGQSGGGVGDVEEREIKDSQKLKEDQR